MKRAQRRRGNDRGASRLQHTRSARIFTQHFRCQWTWKAGMLNHCLLDRQRQKNALSMCPLRVLRVPSCETIARNPMSDATAITYEYRLTVSLVCFSKDYNRSGRDLITISKQIIISSTLSSRGLQSRKDQTPPDEKGDRGQTKGTGLDAPVSTSCIHPNRTT